MPDEDDSKQDDSKQEDEEGEEKKGEGDRDEGESEDSEDEIRASNPFGVMSVTGYGRLGLREAVRAQKQLVDNVMSDSKNLLTIEPCQIVFDEGTVWGARKVRHDCLMILPDKQEGKESGKDSANIFVRSEMWRKTAVTGVPMLARKDFCRLAKAGVLGLVLTARADHFAPSSLQPSCDVM